MKTSTLLKKIQKAGFKAEIKQDSHRQYIAQNGRNIITFYSQDDEAICLHCGYEGQEADSMTDYFPGTFAKNGKQLVTFLLSGSRF